MEWPEERGSWTPEGRLFFHMNAAFDQFQREIIVENTKAGLKFARENGRIGGRPLAMTEEKRRTTRAMLKDTEHYPFITDIIKTLKVGRTTFYHHFPPEVLQQFRPRDWGLVGRERNGVADLRRGDIWLMKAHGLIGVWR